MNVAVPVAPSLTDSVVGENTMLLIVAARQGLVETTSKVTSGTTPLPLRDVVD